MMLAMLLTVGQILCCACLFLNGENKRVAVRYLLCDIQHSFIDANSAITTERSSSIFHRLYGQLGLE